MTEELKARLKPRVGALNCGAATFDNPKHRSNRVQPKPPLDVLVISLSLQLPNKVGTGPPVEIGWSN